MIAFLFEISLSELLDDLRLYMKLRNMTMLLEKFNFVNGEMDYEKMLNSEELIENFKFRHSQFDPSWESRIKPEDLVTYQGNFSLRGNN